MKKDLRYDAFVWVVLIILASAAAFGLLRRDAQRSFGAVAFGSLPDFRFPTVGSGPFDQHMIKGHVWAVHTADSNDGLMFMAGRLSEIEKRTASGKRHLYVLSVAENMSAVLKPLIPFHYIALADPQQRASVFAGFKDCSDECVLLVDQNGVIRGKYDFADIQGFKDFQHDMLKLL